MNTEDISRKVLDAADVVGKKTKSLFEEGKLLIKIRDVERDIEKCYRVIGRFLYENNRSLLDGALEDTALQIDHLTEQLAVLEREYAQVRGMKFCENCNSLNHENSLFCDQCGTEF